MLDIVGIEKVRTVFGILLVFIVLFLLLIMLGYHPQDPSWANNTPTDQVRNPGGIIGSWIAHTLYFLFGAPILLLFPLAIGVSAFHYFRASSVDENMGINVNLVTWISFFLTIVAGCGLASLHFSPGELPVTAGGRIGEIVARNFLVFFGIIGSTLLLFGLMIAGITLMLGLSWLKLMDHIGYSVFWLGAQAQAFIVKWQERRQTQALAKRREQEVIKKRERLIRVEQPKIEPKIPQIKSSKRSEKEKQIKLPNVSASPNELPSLNLLDEITDKPFGYSSEEIEQLAKLLEVKLQEFNIDVETAEAQSGPIITRFELIPAPGTKVSSISNIEKDLARAMSTTSLRVVDVIPGKSVIGIEIPNQATAIVQLAEILSSQKYETTKSPLSLALGKGIAGEAIVVDLAKMPHLLMAGTTGAGKSVAVHVILLSLLFKSSPDKVRLILIDPKMLELKAYEDIPHLMTPVITDMNEASSALRWAVAEMEQRYQLMSAIGARNLEGYNQRIIDAKKKGQPLTDPLIEKAEDSEEELPLLDTLPYLVIVIDEFADLMMVAGKKVEEFIIRLAQKARAAGIHLILATQRPSVDVITGLVKANIPTRIAFQVSSKIDSRTILDQNGAEQLLGKGDMLFLDAGHTTPVRVHGAFVSDQEVTNVTNFLRSAGKPQYNDLNKMLQANEALGAQQGDQQDPLFDKAVEIITESRKASISFLQRRLKIGYNRSAGIIEEMEAMGIVSAVQSNGKREVLAPYSNLS